MRNVLLLIDYQKGFKSEGSKASVPNIEKLAKKCKWDLIIQTMWLNSQEPDSPYVQNLGYSENSAYDRGHALVTLFKDAKVFTRYDKYSCLDDEVARLLHGNTLTYIAGWETDACVLGTCFELFDKGVPFRVVTDCVASERQPAHDAALVIMNRNFGKVVFTTLEEVVSNVR